MAEKPNSTMDRLEASKKTTSKGADYWRARDLMEILTYERWDKFENVLSRAIAACKSTGNVARNHFLRTEQKVALGSGAEGKRGDYFLSRYAAYLVAMNGDPSKAAVADAQTYFAVQTRKRELTEQQMGRLEWREKLKEAAKELNSAAKAAGVKHFGIFHDSGYKGLYGMGVEDIKKRKKIDGKENLFDRAGLTELAANAFRATQTKEVLKKTGVRHEAAATKTHYDVGRKVRDTMMELSGNAPEDLPVEPPIKSLKKKPSPPELPL